MLTLILVKCFENANTHAHKFYTLWLASWKQGRSGCGLRKRKGGEGRGSDAGFVLTGRWLLSPVNFRRWRAVG